MPAGSMQAAEPGLSPKPGGQGAGSRQGTVGDCAQSSALLSQGPIAATVPLAHVTPLSTVLQPLCQIPPVLPNAGVLQLLRACALCSITAAHGRQHGHALGAPAGDGGGPLTMGQMGRVGKVPVVGRVTCHAVLCHQGQGHCGAVATEPSCDRALMGRWDSWPGLGAAFPWSFPCQQTELLPAGSALWARESCPSESRPAAPSSAAPTAGPFGSNHLADPGLPSQCPPLQPPSAPG